MGRHMIDVDSLSMEKHYVLTQMSDEDVSRMLRQMFASKTTGMARDRKKAAGAAPAPKPRPAIELDEATLSKLDRHRLMRMRLDDRCARWLDTTERILGITFQRPRYEGDDQREIYQNLHEVFTQHFLPEGFIQDLIPSLMAYIANGDISRPVIVVGNAGCGKTTALKIIADAMGLKHYHFDALTAFTSHGLYGEGASFAGPDIGEITRGKLLTGVANPFYIVDEVEKSPPPNNRTSLQDELLPICDRSQETYLDNFLGFRLPLSHSIFMFTANSLDGLSEPLLDRCEIVHFPEVDLARMKRIIHSFAEDLQRKKLYAASVRLDDPALAQAVERLYRQGTHSIRQHQYLIEYAFQTAYRRYLTADTGTGGAVAVNEPVFRDAFEQFESHRGNARIGFSH